MGRIEKTVFISYRREDVSWALAIYQDLSHNGYDVFFDFTGIGNGSFESVILENIRARAHFLVLLTPKALDRVGEPEDWLRREIETAMQTRRNIVPVMLAGFDFDMPGVAPKLSGDLADLRGYNGLLVYAAYFEAAMARLRQEYLGQPLEAVAHPPSLLAKEAAKHQQNEAQKVPAIETTELSAAELFQRGWEAETRKNDTDAVAWYRKAADAGHAAGMNNLGVMYDKGRGGLARDESAAVAWYRKAAEAGHLLGMRNLGFMYQN